MYVSFIIMLSIVYRADFSNLLIIISSFFSDCKNVYFYNSNICNLLVTIPWFLHLYPLRQPDIVQQVCTARLFGFLLVCNVQCYGESPHLLLDEFEVIYSIYIFF